MNMHTFRRPRIQSLSFHGSFSFFFAAVTDASDEPDSIRNLPVDLFLVVRSLLKYEFNCQHLLHKDMFRVVDSWFI